jgi:hypothetical protein
MGSPILTAAASVLCPHGGMATPGAFEQRVRIGGQPAARQGAPSIVAGCAGGGQPGGRCLTASWLNGAARVRAGGVPLLLAASGAVAQPTGAALVVVPAQSRVLAV